MSWAQLSLRPLNPLRLAFRRASSNVKPVPNPKIQQETRGYLAYSRNVSRDARYDPSKVPLKGDTPIQFLFRRLGHAYEVYPMFVLTGWWMFLFGLIIWQSFGKVEVWLDRSNETAPWDWTRVKNDYWKKSTVFFDIWDNTHRRLEIMENLQDEMIEAAKKRGTRK